VGPGGTWPRRRPMWRLDQMFVADWLRAGGYRVVDPGVGEHRGQVAKLGARRLTR